MKKYNIDYESFDKVLDKSTDIKYDKKFLKKINKIKQISKYDIILLMNNNINNSSYIDRIIKPVSNKKKFIFDCWNIFSSKKAESLGYKYIGLGKIYWKKTY